MTKAILVIDIPKSCEYCDLYADYIIGTPRCSITYLPVSDNKAIKECPLKPMPKKSCYSPFSSDVGNVKVNNAFINGYNTCIDEILGGTDNE